MGKRTKTVFKNIDECAAAFALQRQDSGCYKYNSRDGSVKNGRAAYFEGKNLYSYGSHYLLARIGLVVGNSSLAVVNVTKYSVTTSGHSHAAAAALRKAGYKVVTFSCEGTGKGIPDDDLADLVFKSILVEASSLREAFKSMRVKGFKPYQIDSVLERVENHNSLVESLDIPRSTFGVMPDFEAVKKSKKLNDINERLLASLSVRVQFSF